MRLCKNSICHSGEGWNPLTTKRIRIAFSEGFRLNDIFVGFLQNLIP